MGALGKGPEKGSSISKVPTDQVSTRAQQVKRNIVSVDRHHTTPSLKRNQSCTNKRIRGLSTEAINGNLENNAATFKQM